MEAHEISQSGYYWFWDPAAKPRGWIIVEVIDGARYGRSEILCFVPGEHDPRELAGMKGEFKGPLSAPDLSFRDGR